MFAKVKERIKQTLSEAFLIQASLIICALYWIFCLFIAQTAVVYDSMSYEYLGNMLAQKGLLEYFKTGPNRELLYPLLVALAMKIGAVTAASYQTILFFFQLGILFITQCLTIKILRKLNIQPAIMAVIILYEGFSPALFTSAFRVYSEIITFPLMLLIVLAAPMAWAGLHKSIKSAVLGGVLLALSFVLMAFSKGIFEVIAPLFLLPTIIYVAKSGFKKDREIFLNGLAFLCSFFIVFSTPINTVKFLNQKYNGNYTFTNRGAWALYGNTARRMEKLTWERFLTALAYVPGWGTCNSLFGPQACAFWSYRESDDLGFKMRQRLEAQGLSKDALNKAFVNLSFQKVLENPPQYLLLTFVEGLKMLFWDSLDTGLTIFPQPVMNIYQSDFLKRVVYYLVAPLTLIALLNLALYLWKSRREIFSPAASSTNLLFFLFLLIIIYICAHSIFYIDPRYSYALGPLYLISIAFLLQTGLKLFCKYFKS